MFWGDSDPRFLLEIVVRTAFMFLYALLLVRLMGKRGISQLTPFEYAIIVALGSSVGDPMVYPDVPLVHGCAVITTVVALQRILSIVSVRSPRVERAVSGAPVTLVRDGRILSGAASKERVSHDELLELLRLKGVASLGDVEWAILEDSGALSVLPRRSGPGDPGLWGLRNGPGEG
jgi:uncharacterized membrane protein YcaP (DUF421 family)